MPALRSAVSILRLFRARAKVGSENALAEKLTTTSVQLVRDQPGFMGLLAAGPANDIDHDFVFATIWRDAEAVRAFFGEDWHVSLLPPGYSELIDACSVEHYELTEQLPRMA